MIAPEKILGYLEFLKRRGTLNYAGTRGEAPGLVRSRKESEESMSKSLPCFYRK